MKTLLTSLQPPHHTLPSSSSPVPIINPLNPENPLAPATIPPLANTSHNTQTNLPPKINPFIDLGSDDSGTTNTPYHLSTRFSKVEFPRFDGTDLEGWLFKCDRFFQIDYTPLNAKVKLVVIHMEGRALQ